MKRADLIAEVEHLGHTDTPAAIARRPGYARPDYLARALMRAGRHDLAHRFNSRKIRVAS